MSRDPIAATDRPTVRPGTYQLYIDEIIQKLTLNTNDILLDIGCGTGIIDANLSEFVKRIVATDFSKIMAQKARNNRGIRENVDFVNCDSTSLPFKDGAFSKVLIYAVVQYLSHDQIKSMLGEARRLTRSGGLIMMGEIPRSRDTSLWNRIRDVWKHRGLRGILSKFFNHLLECWLRITGRWTHRFVRPEGPPEVLHSEGELLDLVHQCVMRGWVLPLGRKLPWFHQTFDLLVVNIPPGESVNQGYKMQMA